MNMTEPLDFLNWDCPIVYRLRAEFAHDVAVAMQRRTKLPDVEVRLVVNGLSLAQVRVH